MDVPGHRAGPGTRSPRQRSASPGHEPAPLPSDARDEISCRGHAFDEDLVCSCGVTWQDHQRRPRPCRIHAQRCHRAGETPQAVPPAPGPPSATQTHDPDGPKG
jgi:hypothetical protein